MKFYKIGTGIRISKQTWKKKKEKKKKKKEIKKKKTSFAEVFFFVNIHFSPFWHT